MAIWNVTVTMIVPIVFGMMWRRMIRHERPPITWTACTYSRVRRVSVSPRTSRAGISHETSDEQRDQQRQARA